MDIQPNLGITDEKLKQVETIFPYITERKAPLSISNISTRSYYHWKTMSLVDHVRMNEDKRNWIKVNIYDYIWLEIIQAARTFGVSISDLLKVKSELLKIPSFEMSEDLDILKDNFLDFEIGGEPVFTLEQIQEKIDVSIHIRNTFSELNESDKFNLTVLGSYINHSLLTNEKIVFCLFKDESTIEASILTEREFRCLEEIAPDLASMPCLSINLYHLIERFIGEPRNEKNLSRWGFINEDEKKVLKAIRNKKFSQIIIKRLNNSEELKIEATMDDDILQEKAKQIRKILGLDEYSEVHVKFRNDKHLFVKRTKKL